MASTHPSEISRHQDKVVDASQKALDQIHSDPQQFLAILQKNYNSIASNPTDGITLPDLKLYAEHGSDAAGRQAALELATNFTAAVNMFQTTEKLGTREGSPPNNMISSAELNDEQKIVSGDYMHLQEDAHIAAVKAALLGGTTSVIGIVGAIGLLECPPLSVGAGVLALGGAAVAIERGKRALDLPAEYKAAESSGKNLIGSWQK